MKDISYNRLYPNHCIFRYSRPDFEPSANGRPRGGSWWTARVSQRRFQWLGIKLYSNLIKASFWKKCRRMSFIYVPPRSAVIRLYQRNGAVLLPTSSLRSNGTRMHLIILSF